jgi:UDP-N-acetyl-D-mannosaminuronate dehydrogenase
VLGLAYRAGVKESRHSSALPLAGALIASGATAYVHDPLYGDEEIRAHGLEPPPAFPLACDAIVVQAWHDAYASLDFARFGGLRAILDGRNALDPAAIAKLGIAYVGIGR